MKKKGSTKTHLTRIRGIEGLWDRARLESLIQSFQGKKILVVGDIGIDRYTIGAVERISPEAPVPIVRVEEEKFKLGLAANVAENVCSLGGQVWLTGVLGKDRAATDFRKLVKGKGISTAYLVADSSRRTTLKDRIVSDRQQLLRVDYENPGKVSGSVEKAVCAGIKRLIPKADVVILQDYAKGLLTPTLVETVFDTARRFGKIVAVDPNPRTSIDLYRGGWVLTPNTKEAERLSGVIIRDSKSLQKAGQALLDLTGANHVVITRGKEGMAIFSAGRGKAQLIPTYAREVYDVSGAGDTVITIMGLALSAGATIEESALLGNLGAGIVVGKRGTATVSPDEIRQLIDFFEGKSFEARS